MFSISKQTGYALITVASLEKETDFVALSILAEKTKMPLRFLARIAAELTHHGILLSKEGKSGGYKLLKKLDDISLYDFLKIFEKDLSLTCCEEASHTCECEPYCPHKDFFTNKLAKLLYKQLKNYSLAEVFEK